LRLRLSARSATGVLPSDPTHKRRCTDILIGFQTWMAGKGLAVEITTLPYNRSRYYLSRKGSPKQRTAEASARTC